MPKRQAQKRRAGRKTGTRRARRKTRNTSMVPAKLYTQICSITDPFCPSAVGSKYPDSTSTKTLAWDAEMFYTITTDASGRGGVFFGSCPLSGYASVLTWAGATMTPATVSSGQIVPGWADWNAVSGVSYRVVSSGVIARSIASAMTNSGSIGIAVVPNSESDIDASACDLNAMTFAENLRISMSSGKEISAISHSDVSVSKRFKYATSTATPFVSSYGNDVLAVYVTGGPASTACVQVRAVWHYELTFSTGTVFNNVATPAALENNTVQTGSNFVKNAIDQVVIGGASEVERRVMSSASAFGRFLVRGAAGAIGGYLGGPAGASMGYHGAGMIMDVD